MDCETLYTFIFLLLLTLIFFSVWSQSCNDRNSYKKNIKDSKDGNGKHQYKGRGYKNETIDILLNRINWLVKNNYDKNNYNNIFIITYIIILFLTLILYGYSSYLLSFWELALIFIVIFVILLSVNNFNNFHDNIYHYYYIKKNIEYITDQLNLNIKFDTPKPNKKSYIEDITEIKRFLKEQ